MGSDGESDDVHEKSPDAPDSPDDSLVVRRQLAKNVPGDHTPSNRNLGIISSASAQRDDDREGVRGDDVEVHEDSTPERFDGTPRLWGIDGLLATPHVKVLLVLGFALQV